jgi:DNA-binding NarL/FixJ family response regulator
MRTIASGWSLAPCHDTVSKLRVFHCDDSSSFQVLVRHWLEEHADLEWVGAERDPARVAGAVAACRPDVVLLDTMGHPGDAELVRAVRAAAPGVKVIVYSGYVSMLGPDRLGGDADGYLDKSEDDGALVELIRSVCGRAA